MSLTTILIGRGRAGRAIENALSILQNSEPNLGLAPVKWLQRNQKISDVVAEPSSCLVAIAGPNGLHADRILEADRLKVPLIITEKPLCVRREELADLNQVSAKVAVLHVYRQMWGPQTIRQMIERGELGDLVTIEGRYWHSSSAQRAIQRDDFKENWKNDPKLCGPNDVLLDVGTHWLDMAFFLNSPSAKASQLWLSYANAERPHRDTHLHISTDFQNGCRAFGSISKIAHGSTDHFEVTVIGSTRSASWTFAHPDEIYIGEGRSRTLITRADSKLGSKQPPFRGLGWLEGYIEILRQSIYDLQGREHSAYPNLKQTTGMMNHLFESNSKR